jgi:hypothetical protein
LVTAVNTPATATARTTADYMLEVNEVNTNILLPIGNTK